MNGRMAKAIAKKAKLDESPKNPRRYSREKLSPSGRGGVTNIAIGGRRRYQDIKAAVKRHKRGW